MHLAGLETLAGAVLGVVFLLLLDFLSGVHGQEPPLPSVWGSSSTKGKSSFKTAMSRVSQAGIASGAAGLAELGLGTIPAGDVVDLLEGDEADPLDGDAVDFLDGDVVDLLDGDAVDLLDGDAVDLLDGDAVDFLDGDGSFAGFLHVRPCCISSGRSGLFSLAQADTSSTCPTSC